jgi:hypothetical protein
MKGSAVTEAITWIRLFYQGLQKIPANEATDLPTILKSAYIGLILVFQRKP